MARVLLSLDEAGYDSEWQVFNTKYSYIVGETVINSIPQNRERVYIIGHLRKRGRREVFPIARADGENIAELQRIGNIYGNADYGTGYAGNIWNKNGISPTLMTAQGGAENLTSQMANIHSEPKVIGGLYTNDSPEFHHGILPNCSRCLKGQKYDASVAIGEPRAVLTPDREEKRQNGRRMKENGEPMFTLTAQDRHGVAINETDTDKICKTD